MRKWALRLCIYSYAADLALVVLFWRYVNENLFRPDIIDRVTILYSICITSSITSLVLLLLADFKKVPDPPWKVALYVFVMIALSGKALNYLNQTGFYWVYYWNDIKGLWPY